MSEREYEIDDLKIEAYLLNLAHKRGGSKAKFFLARGFSLGDTKAFAYALATHAHYNWPGTVTAEAYGEKHAIEAPLACPDGTSPTILAVWKVETGSMTASLVTAYPHR